MVLAFMFMSFSRLFVGCPGVRGQVSLQLTPSEGLWPRGGLGLVSSMAKTESQEGTHRTVTLEDVKDRCRTMASANDRLVSELKRLNINTLSETQSFAKRRTNDDDVETEEEEEG